MKLAKLLLDGFKSFAHRTEITFDEGITVLVGPNGCGKSNIVDSIKWVLGERSIKSLRSEEMLDVIFNGASDLKPSGYAEVSLSFTNSNGSPKLPLDYEEITVTRRLHRSGESEYLINNQSCRLKDIRELFMGTGVGMEFYSIIEQGRVDFILRGSPVERRELLDEAAGISKYKAKRHESEAKLQRVEEDLIRLSDILREVRREIRSIKIQATKAEKYKNTLGELKAQKTQLALHTYHQYHQKQLELSAKLNEVKETQGSLEEKLQNIESTIIDIDKEFIQIDNDIAGYQETLIGLSGQISETKHKIESTSLRRQELIAEEESIRKTLASSTQKAVELRNRLCEIIESYETQKKELELLNDELEQKNTLYKEVLQELETVSRNIEDKRNETFQTTHKKSQYQNELSAIQNELKNLSARRDKFAVKHKQIEEETGGLTQDKTKLESSREKIQETINNLKQTLSQQEMVTRAIKNDLTSINGEVNRLKEESNKMVSRKEVLEDMERLHEGCSNSVRSVLEADSTIGATIYGLVADLIEIKPHYVNAAEAALKDLADALVVASQDDGLKVIQFIRDNQKGRITTIAIEKLKTFTLRSPLPHADGVLGYADEIIQGIKLDNISPDIKASLGRILLGKYLLVDNLNTAQQIITEHLYDGKILTLQGEIITSEGIISGGSTEPGIGLISRKTELRHLNEQVVILLEQLENLLHIQSNKTAEIETTELESQKLRNLCYEQSVNLVDTEKSVSEIERRLSIIAKETEIINLEQSEVEQQIHSLSDRAVSTAQVISELEKELEKLQSGIEQLNISANEYTQKKQLMETEVTELKVKQAKSLSNKEHLLQQQTQLNNDAQQLESTLEMLARSLQEIKNRISESECNIKSDETLLKKLSDEQDKIQSLTSELKEKAQNLKNRLIAYKTEEEKIQDEIHSAQNSINGLSLEEREYLLKTENICEKHKEETSTDLRELYLSYHPAPLEAKPREDNNLSESLTSHSKNSSNGLKISENLLLTSEQAIDSANSSDWQQVNKSIEELAKRISEMGNDVNLSAIDQLKSLEERNNTLSIQEQDLIKSKESLKDFIYKTNRECRERFDTTFEVIRENFNQLFRKLFGGGRAELILQKVNNKTETAIESSTTPSESSPTSPLTSTSTPLSVPDNLEAGIEIIAKPPGKEPTSISLLSGGEKTLTALALIMAIFKLQPSPFCILDEADSTLDENNIDRFRSLIQEFSNETQFIVITHNKKTMLCGEMLYGLTMSQPGISRKISVKINEIEKFLAKIPDESPASPASVRKHSPIKQVPIAVTSQV